MGVQEAFSAIRALMSAWTLGARPSGAAPCVERLHRTRKAAVQILALMAGKRLRAVVRLLGFMVFQPVELGSPGFLVLWRENQPNLFMREKQQPFSQALETLETPKHIDTAKLCRALRGQPDEGA